MEQLLDLEKHECKTTALADVDGPYFDGAETFAQGELYAGQAELYYMRCRQCDGAIELVRGPALHEPWGGRWSTKHRAFAIPYGTAGGRAERPARAARSDIPSPVIVAPSGPAQGV